MADSSTFGSNNPFRRKQQAEPGAAAPPPPSVSTADVVELNPVFDSATPSPLPTGDQFRSQLRSLPQSVQPPPKTSFQKPKVVKKVRVQSPPPSSPESAGAPDPYPAAGRYDRDDSSEDDDDELENPFGGAEQQGLEPTGEPPTERRPAHVSNTSPAKSIPENIG